MKLRLAAAALLCVLTLVGVRHQAERHVRAGDEAVHGDARLVSERRPRAAVCRDREWRLSRGGAGCAPVVPSETAEPLKLLAAGKVDMAISYEPELLLARDQGLKLVSIAALVQRPLTSIIALGGQHVQTVADLAGKRVGTAGINYQALELQTALKSASVDPSTVHEVNVGFNLVPAMLAGKVAATLGGFWNYEAIQLRLMHKHPVVIPVNKAGVPSYDELVLVVREDEARHRGEELRAFLQALTRGERAVRASPKAAAALVVKANPSLEPKLQLESIRQTLPAALPANSSNPYGWQEPSQWASFRRLDVRERAAAPRPQRRAAAVHERVPARTGHLVPGPGI